MVDAFSINMSFLRNFFALPSPLPFCPAYPSERMFIRAGYLLPLLYFYSSAFAFSFAFFVLPTPSCR
jgi:hypothetical protein